MSISSPRPGLSVQVGPHFLSDAEFWFVTKSLPQGCWIDQAWVDARGRDQAGDLMSPVRRHPTLWLVRQGGRVDDIAVYDLAELEPRPTQTLKSWSKEAGTSLPPKSNVSKTRASNDRCIDL